MKFRKKPVVIDAVRWIGDNFDELREFARPADVMHWFNHGTLGITTLEGTMKADIGDWIIKGVKGVKGEFYPCKPDIFDATYERVLLEDAANG